MFLPAIAWHLHHTTSSGLIGQEELHHWLVATLRQCGLRLSEPEAHVRAAQFRRHVSEFSQYQATRFVRTILSSASLTRTCVGRHERWKTSRFMVVRVIGRRE